MRRLLVLVLAAVALAGPSAAAASSSASPFGVKPVVELMTTSGYVSTQDLQNGLAAFQTMVSRDLAPAWGTDAQLIVGDPAHPSPADMTVMVSDTPDCFWCGGYHGVTPNGQPFAKAFYMPDESWTLVLTHELQEMLVDPDTRRFQQAADRMWLLEVSDPVESGFYAYQIDGVWMSDFILPAWYQARSKGPYDFTGMLWRPFQIGRHGYASWRTDSGWHQAFG